MDTAERRATAALWSFPGVGPVTLREVRKHVGSLGELLHRPVSEWAPLVPWHGASFAHVMAAGTLAFAAERLEERCRAHGARILFSGDPAFPWRLEDIPKAPALLFAFGPGAEGPARRRLAIVGTRRIDNACFARAHAIAAEAARFGLCVVSGAAEGTDTAAHLGAIAAKGETWAFMGSALDELDSSPRRVAQQIIDKGGTVFSEFPPGFRANKNSFTHRNRLISGASDAVLVFRAPLKSGALHTAKAAVLQGRPVVVTPGDQWDPRCEGSNALLRDGVAQVHVDLGDLLKAVGLDGSISPQTPIALDLSQLSPRAAEVLALLGQGSSDFEGLQGSLPAASSGELSSALVELEVFGAVVHKGGRRYEKR